MQTLAGMIPYYSKHLNNDEVVGTREFELKKLNDTLGLIAKIKDRILDMQETSKKMYGTDKDGKIMTNKKIHDKYIMFAEMLKRVKSYYNNQLTKLKQF